MEFENTFLVQAPVDEVWDLLLDVERIAPCMPGAQVLEQTGDDAYKVAVKIRLGPMTMNYKGDVEILDKDASTRQATMRAKAKEARGQGTASADIRMALREQPGGTEASIITSMQMSGKAAAMGQGIIKDVAASLTDTFAQNLAAMVDRGGAPAPAPPSAAAAAAAAPDGAIAPPPPPSPSPADAALPVGTVVKAAALGRLRDPRTLGVLAAALAVGAFLLGRRRS
ncbi:MAG TPA: SRPBCC family protein [Baekduia sp.]|jgi:carbon monoxide dehydrogenase subunit G|nr:SRPBCC family protein [Baekduia sp.]